MLIYNKKILNWFLLIFWAGVIFFLSSQPDLKSGFENWIDFILRKIAHIAEYGILTFLAWRAFGGWRETKFPIGNLVSKIPRGLIYAVIFSILYAISDEYHQTFVHSRAGSPIDVLIDSVGILIVALLIGRKYLKYPKIEIK